MGNYVKRMFLAGFVAPVFVLISCSSISESECMAGNWADIGYRDGLNGKQRTKITDYVKECAEYGASVDRQTYIESYEVGLSYYCTYEQGFERGKKGYGYNAVCTGPLAADFRAGYDEGYIEYELRRTYSKYQADIEQTEAELQDVKDRIADPEIDEDEKKRLQKKRKRLSRKLKNLIWEFRDFRQKHDLFY